MGMSTTTSYANTFSFIAPSSYCVHCNPNSSLQLSFHSSIFTKLHLQIYYLTHEHFPSSCPSTSTFHPLVFCHCLHSVVEYSCKNITRILNKLIHLKRLFSASFLMYGYNDSSSPVSWDDHTCFPHHVIDSLQPFNRHNHQPLGVHPVCHNFH